MDAKGLPWVLVLVAVPLLVGACEGSVPRAPVAPPAPADSVQPTPRAAPPDDMGPALQVIDPIRQAQTVEGVRALCDDNLAVARKILAAVEARDPSRPAGLTWDNTLARLDDAFLAIDNASQVPFLMGQAHPDQAVRDAAQECEKKTDELVTSIYLNARLAAVIKAYADKVALPIAGGGGEQPSGERRRFLEHTLRDFRRNGLELPADKQARLRAINSELTELGQKFISEISRSKGEIRIKPAQLAGLDDAFKKKHPVGAGGKVTVTTDYTDYYPFVTYATDRQAARELYVEFVNRGGDANVARLAQLLSLRHEKATMLGYASWADYAIEPRMAKKASEARAFLGRVKRAIAPAVERELRDFRAEHAKASGSGPSHKMTPPDRYFLADRLQKRRFRLDSQKLAEYFDVAKVTEGLLDITSTMYGLKYVAVPDGDRWHPDVKVYDVLSGDKPIARFLLDLHPRDNKYKHAAMFTVRSGKTLASGERQTPIATLVCNFPRPGEPMPHSQVVTYFHEFGHVLHHILTDTELASFSGTNTARDFVEAPSQMFEEWAWSRPVLDRLARHQKTGAKIPDDVFNAMQKARKLGQALATERQIFLASLDLGYHAAKPPFDTTRLLKEIHERTFSFEYVEGTHFQSSFSHLVSYDAGYYGYQWALSLAHDVLSRFKKQGLLDPAVAADWRKLVLSRGGSRDERAMIQEFLGREPSEQAYADFLSTD